MSILSQTRYLGLLTEDEFQKKINNDIVINRITLYTDFGINRWYFYFLYDEGSYYISNDLLIERDIRYDHYICNGYIISYYDNCFNVRYDGHEFSIDNVDELYSRLSNMSNEFIDYIASSLMLRDC